MANKKPTHIMVHGRKYMRAGGEKLQHIPAGTPLALSDDQARRLGNDVKPIGDEAVLDLSKAEADAKAAEEAAKAEAEAKAAAKPK